MSQRLSIPQVSDQLLIEENVEYDKNNRQTLVDSGSINSSCRLRDCYRSITDMEKLTNSTPV